MGSAGRVIFSINAVSPRLEVNIVLSLAANMIRARFAPLKRVPSFHFSIIPLFHPD
jgi:hypothetical protein